MRPRETLPAGDWEITEINGYKVARAMLKIMGKPEEMLYQKKNGNKYWMPTTDQFILKFILQPVEACK